MIQNPRQVAFLALKAVHRGSFADAALDRTLGQVQLEARDRRLATELVYGTIRRQRTLDALIDQFGKKPAAQQPPDLRLILHLGLYQLRYLSQIPVSATVDTAVELAKQNRLSRLAGVVNGLLRQYIRAAGPSIRSSQDAGSGGQGSTSIDPLRLPADRMGRLALLHSYPDWMLQVWQQQLTDGETEQLCQWFNQTPHIDLRINSLRTNIDQVQTAFETAHIPVERLPSVPQALRLQKSPGRIQELPGFSEGWWTVQDSSAQLVAALLDPQPEETIIDACSAPGGKTSHIAELMGDQGVIWACDRNASRLKKLTANQERLGLQSIQAWVRDSRAFEPPHLADRVLLDAPCSGLGTLHRHADARWRQSPESIRGLATLQAELLMQATTWVKPGGKLVYATCTLHPEENEAVIEKFLETHPQWCISTQSAEALSLPSDTVTAQGWIQVWPHRHDMDGFFMVCLERTNSSVRQSRSQAVHPS